MSHQTDDKRERGELVKEFVKTHVMNHPGCLASEIGRALTESGLVEDPTFGSYNYVAWAIRSLREAGFLKDDLPRCGECDRILNRSPRKLYPAEVAA